MEVLLINALLRIAVLIIILCCAIRYRDYLAIAIAVLYGVVIFGTRILQLDTLTSVAISTPIVFLMAVYMINAMRFKYNITRGYKK